jgi:hypothetical protein
VRVLPQRPQVTTVAVLGLTARKLPSLPRGLPTPDPAATSYAVYVTDKHWRRVEQSMADQAKCPYPFGQPRG